MKIPSNDLIRQYHMYKSEYDKKAIDVLESGWYILGKEVSEFEKEFADYLEKKHTVGVASGLDALIIALKSLGLSSGDEVIVPANTYIATVMGITSCGATPTFVEPDEYFNIDTNKIVPLITEKTKAIMSVNLYGQSCNMRALRKICDEHNLHLIEDCAQSHGSLFDQKHTTSFADVSCYSFYPSKNLGAFSDAGALVTDIDEIASRAKIIRNYGSEKRYHNEIVGMNSRLSEMQAGLLRVKLSHIEELTAQRCEIAQRYLNEITNENVKLPQIQGEATSVWHLFVVITDKRDAFIKYMEEKGIGILVHYPIPPHLSAAYENLGYKQGDFPITEMYAKTVATLPLYNGMTHSEQTTVIDAVNDWR